MIWKNENKLSKFRNCLTMNNIFENAYFGKAYKTRIGRKAIYIKNLSDYTYHHQLVLDNGDIGVYDNFGKPYGDNVLDIVSEWHEEINEEKLDELASKIYPYDEDNIPLQGIYMCNLRNIWKAGYRKAKQPRK